MEDDLQVLDFPTFEIEEEENEHYNKLAEEFFDKPIERVGS